MRKIRSLTGNMVLLYKNEKSLFINLNQLLCLQSAQQTFQYFSQKNKKKKQSNVRNETEIIFTM